MKKATPQAGRKDGVVWDNSVEDSSVEDCSVLSGDSVPGRSRAVQTISGWGRALVAGLAWIMAQRTVRVVRVGDGRWRLVRRSQWRNFEVMTLGGRPLYTLNLSDAVSISTLELKKVGRRGWRGPGLLVITGDALASEWYPQSDAGGDRFDGLLKPEEWRRVARRRYGGRRLVTWESSPLAKIDPGDVGARWYETGGRALNGMHPRAKEWAEREGFEVKLPLRRDGGVWRGGAGERRPRIRWCVGLYWSEGRYLGLYRRRDGEFLGYLDMEELLRSRIATEETTYAIRAIRIWEDGGQAGKAKPGEAEYLEPASWKHLGQIIEQGRWEEADALPRGLRKKDGGAARQIEWRGEPAWAKYSETTNILEIFDEKGIRRASMERADQAITRAMTAIEGEKVAHGALFAGTHHETAADEWAEMSGEIFGMVFGPGVARVRAASAEEAVEIERAAAVVEWIRATRRGGGRLREWDQRTEAAARLRLERAGVDEAQAILVYELLERSTHEWWDERRSGSAELRQLEPYREAFKTADAVLS